jgi:hypothetical protein
MRSAGRQSRRGGSGAQQTVPRGLFLVLTLATSATALAGFSLTYFMPLVTRGIGSEAPVVHLHGWSFFLWYIASALRFGRGGRPRIHRPIPLRTLISREETGSE